MRRPVTKQNIEDMTTLFNKGYSVNYVASKLGFSHPTVKKYVAKPTTKKTTRVGSVSNTLGGKTEFTTPTVFTQKQEGWTTFTAKELVEAIKLVKSFGIKVEF